MTDVVVLILVLGGTGVLLLALGVAGGAGVLPRNTWAGYRLPSTMRSPEAWARAHRAAAIPTSLAGIVSLIAAVGVLFSRASEDHMAAWGIGAAVAILVFVVIGAVIAHRAAR